MLDVNLLYALFRKDCFFAKMARILLYDSRSEAVISAIRKLCMCELHTFN